MPKKKNPAPKDKSLGTEISREFVNYDELKTDPLGSWTGTPRDKDDVPTQDADDL